MWDEEVFPEPEKYDAHRFVEIRKQTGQDHKAQLTTTENHFLAFGRGKHECPGRFFAANEVKIAMAYTLMNYDVRLKGDEKPTHTAFGFELLASGASIQVRRRKAEIDLDQLA
jgi:cytochrome P450